MAFITEVKGLMPHIKKYHKDGNQPEHESLLHELVHIDHKKLKEVVIAFSRKVEILIEKQRAEYTGAYEYHMVDVQKELFNLREKVTGTYYGLLSLVVILVLVCVARMCTY